MPISTTLDWSSASSNGDYTLGSGVHSIDVNIETTTNDTGQTGTVQSLDGSGEDGLWVDGITDGVTTTMTFEKPVENLSFEILDLDQNGTVWDERVTILATDADGNIIPISYADLTAMHTATGTTVDADGSNDLATDGSGAADSISVSIPGPIVALEIIFEPGESAASTGALGLSDVSFDIASDGIVEGTSGADVIGAYYLDDPEGDQTTDGDDVIYAGDGNDTIDAGAGNDFVSAGDGADLTNLREGNDTFYGGAGDDTVNGNYGNDVLHGGTGDDFLQGSYGNDTIHSGTTGDGDDYLWGGFGDDTFVIQNGFGNDTIDAENQDEINGDTLDLSNVTDDLTIDLTQVTPGSGTFTDGTDTAQFDYIENITLSAGQDTLVLDDGSGVDRVTDFQIPSDNGDGTYTSHDKLDVSGLTYDYGARAIHTGDVVISSDADGHAVLTFPSGDSLVLEGVSADDISDPDILAAMGIPAGPDGTITGTAGADVFVPGTFDADGDLVDGGDALLAGMSGDDDRILTEGGADSVNAGAGHDYVDGGAGNDTLYGAFGDDTLIAGTGSDTLYGGADNDTLYTGSDSTLMDGGTGDDLFIGATAGDTIEGGDGNDTLNLTGTGAKTIDYDPADSTSGTISFLDEDGAVTGTARFKDIETIVPCFTPGTRVATDRGLSLVETLSEGDLVLTRDHGLQPIRWVGRRDLTAKDLSTLPHLRGVKIAADALGDGLPHRDMIVSPNHRILLSDPKMELMFGASEVLVAAKHLLHLPGITRDESPVLSYIHFMFERHEIVFSDNIWSESFQPGQQAMMGLEGPQRAEIYELFPDLADDPQKVFPTARRVAQKHEARLLTP